MNRMHIVFHLSNSSSYSYRSQADGVQRLPTWKKLGWRKLNGKALTNLNLWKQIDVALNRLVCPVDVVHVPQHVHIRGNTARQYLHFRAKLKNVRKQKRVPSQESHCSAPTTSIPVPPMYAARPPPPPSHSVPTTSIPAHSTASATSIPVRPVVYTHLYTDGSIHGWHVSESHSAPTTSAPVLPSDNILHVPVTHMGTVRAPQPTLQQSLPLYTHMQHLSMHSPSTE